jgi:hypothetical protein
MGPPVTSSVEQRRPPHPKRGGAVERKVRSQEASGERAVPMPRQGFDEAQRLIILSDGADWIRSDCGWIIRRTGKWACGSEAVPWKAPTTTSREQG